MEGYITTTEAAERLGVSPARVRQLVSSGELPVTKFGPVNMVKESDLSLVEHRRGVGRPPKVKPAETTANLRESFQAATKASGTDGRVRVTKKAGGKKGGRK